MGGDPQLLPGTYPTAPVTIGPNLVLSPDPTAPGEYVVGAQTLIPGAPAVTVDGTVISLDPAGTAVVVDRASTINVGSFGNNGYPTVITLGSHRITANQSGRFIIDSQTLIPGGPAATVDGTVYTLPMSGTAPVPILTLALTSDRTGDFIIQGLGVTTISHGTGTATISGVSVTENSSTFVTSLANESGKGSHSDTTTKKNQAGRVCDTNLALSWEALLFGAEFIALLWV